MFCDQIVYFLQAAFLDCLIRKRASIAQLKLLAEDRLQICCKDHAGATGIGSVNLLAKITLSKAADARIQLSIQLSQCGSAVGKYDFMLPDESTKASLSL